MLCTGIENCVHENAVLSGLFIAVPEKTVKSLSIFLEELREKMINEGK
jgi:hypothetical protein